MHIMQVNIFRLHVSKDTKASEKDILIYPHAMTSSILVSF